MPRPAPRAGDDGAALDEPVLAERADHSLRLLHGRADRGDRDPRRSRATLPTRELRPRTHRSRSRSRSNGLAMRTGRPFEECVRSEEGHADLRDAESKLLHGALRTRNCFTEGAEKNGGETAHQN